ncbi:MAG: MBL fold metallo-hydrolase [Clostridia bacterium]|nr:MBL fold metallo-hydrolase [Clostridia bacterium]
MPMEKLHVLGTGYALATRCYNTCFAIENDASILLVDAGGGNGILRQMEDANLSFARVHDLFITHAHPDHLNGVVWVLRKIMTMMNAGKYEGELHIYCHASVREGIEMISKLMLQKKMLVHMGKRIFMHDIEDGMKATLAGYETTFFDIHSTKLLQFGFTLTLESGKKLTCLGDEPYNPVTKPYVEGSDWLLCEAFCLLAHADIFKPYEKNHSTVADAAKLAAELSIPHVVLWHTEDRNYAQRKALYTAEARESYDGDLYVPNDLEVIVL